MSSDKPDLEPPPAALSLTPRQSSMTRRRAVLVVILLVCLGLGGISGYLLGTTRSPADAALAQSPPPPSVLTATVTSEVVASTVLGQGSVQIAAPINVDVPPASNGRQVLSRTDHAPGTSVNAGDVLAEVSGRPVIMLQGSVTPYRDLSFGDSGTDVTQLQTGLKALGYGASMSGKIDSATCTAVRHLYLARHYTIPVGTTDTSGSTPSGTDPAGAAIPTTCQGLTIPIAELWFVHQLPLTVVSFQVDVGQQLSASKPLAVLSDGGLQLTVTLEPALAASVTAGMSAVISTGTSTVAGHVVSSTVVTNAGTGTTQGSVVVAPVDALPSDLLGSSLRVTITRAATDGPVLAVPLSAIYTSPDGTVFVIKQDTSGQQTRIAVTPGVVGDASVQITPTAEGDISVGDTVVIGA